MSDNWQYDRWLRAWRWMWESIGCDYIRDEYHAGRHSLYWWGYFDIGNRWANALLGPECWREPPPDPPYDDFAKLRAQGAA